MSIGPTLCQGLQARYLHWQHVYLIATYRPLLVIIPVRDPVSLQTVHAKSATFVSQQNHLQPLSFFDKI